jgi:hypothetical protein
LKGAGGGFKTLTFSDLVLLGLFLAVAGDDGSFLDVSEMVALRVRTDGLATAFVAVVGLPTMQDTNQVKKESSIFNYTHVLSHCSE